MCDFLCSRLSRETQIPQEKFTPNGQINIPGGTLSFRKGNALEGCYQCDLQNGA